MSHSIFISHSSKDDKLFAALIKSLRSAGVEVWDPAAELYPGDNWLAVTGRAMAQSDAVIFLFSKDAVESQWVRREFEYAITNPKFKNRVLPVFIGSPTKEFPWIARKLQPLQLPARISPELAAKKIVEALPAAVK